MWHLWKNVLQVVRTHAMELTQIIYSITCPGTTCTFTTSWSTPASSGSSLRATCPTVARFSSKRSACRCTGGRSTSRTASRKRRRTSATSAARRAPRRPIWGWEFGSLKFVDLKLHEFTRRFISTRTAEIIRFRAQCAIDGSRVRASWRSTWCGMKVGDLNLFNLSLTKLIFNSTGIKRYTCSVCGLKKTTVTELKIHMNTHTREKVYPCDVCSAVFSTIGKCWTIKRNLKNLISFFQVAAVAISRLFTKVSRRSSAPTARSHSGRPKPSNITLWPIPVRHLLWFINCLISNRILSWFSDRRKTSRLWSMWSAIHPAGGTAVSQEDSQ